MYEDLVKALRNCSDCYCGDCKYYDLMKPGNCVKCMDKLIDDAADAIGELSAQCDDLHDALIVLDAVVPRWIPVSERLPEEKTNPNTLDFEWVLCATTFGDVRAYKFGTPIGWDNPHFWIGGGLHGVTDRYVTHWMPLPEPPKDGDA